LSHPLEAYLAENKNGAVTDEQAKASISVLVNDPALLQDVCATFASLINGADRCYAVGKVYDVEDQRYGCLTVLSEDVVGIINPERLQETHELINYTLLCAYLEYRRFCQEVKAMYDAWDDYLNFIVQKSFVTLYKNGMRARLIHTDSVGEAAMPTVAFIIYLDYGEIYG